MNDPIASPFVELPQEMRNEIVNRCDPPSALSLALTTPNFYYYLSTNKIIDLLKGKLFLFNICEYGHERQFEWLFEEFKKRRKPSSLDEQQNRLLVWAHAYKAAKSGNLSLLMRIQNVLFSSNK